MNDLSQAERRFPDRFIRQLDQLGIALDERRLEMLYAYFENLSEWNTRINLTAINGIEDVCDRYFADSLSLVKCIPARELHDGRKIIDVGTGAGFPGLVLAIAFPECRFVLADSLKKRIGFLDDTIRKLGLENTETVHGRAEDLASDMKFRETFDIAVSRAVSSLPVLLEYCLPFVKTGGVFVAYKGDKLEQELKESEKALKVLGGKITDRSIFMLPETDFHRELLRVEKVSATPSRYPRKAGTPAASPIR